MAREKKAGRAWAIKLGSGGRCVPFCETHGIVGVGWRAVDARVLATGTREDIWAHVAERCTFYGGDRQKVGKAVGQLYRFARECAVGDYVIYYDPPRKHVRIARVTSDAMFRDFAPSDDTDIWHFRRVELAPKAVPVVDFYGGLKGALLGPRMSFWSVADAEAVALLFRGESPHIARASDPEVESAYEALRNLLVKRAENLTDTDWEWLGADAPVFAPRLRRGRARRSATARLSPRRRPRSTRRASSTVQNPICASSRVSIAADQERTVSVRPPGCGWPEGYRATGRLGGCGGWETGSG